jgi:hypothetical protein
LLYGELGINYHKGTETISLKNDNDEVVMFHDEVEITSGSPKVNTEIWIDTSDATVTEVYTKSEIDSQFGAIVNDIARIDAKNASQDDEMSDIETSVGGYFDGVSYDEARRAIDFKHGSEVKASIDATPFIKDGMVDSVAVLNGKLIISFNVESGKQALAIPISDIFNADNYYTKDDIDSMENTQNGRLDAIETSMDDDYYTKGEIDTVETTQNNRITALEDASLNYYTKNEIDAAEGAQNTLISDLQTSATTLASKIDELITVGGSEPSTENGVLYVDTNEGSPYEVYTKAQVDLLIADLQAQIDALRG